MSMLQTTSTSVVNYKTHKFPKCDAYVYWGKKFYFRLLDTRTSGEVDVLARNITSYYAQTLKVSSNSDESFMGSTLGRQAKNKLSPFVQISLCPNFDVLPQTDYQSCSAGNHRVYTAPFSQRRAAVWRPYVWQVRHSASSNMAHMRVCQTRSFVPTLRRHNFRVPEVSQTKLSSVLDHHQYYILQLMSLWKVQHATYRA